jgi:hypothetical protein
MQLSIDQAARQLQIDGRPAFLLADTVWAAFSRPDLDEWRGLLRLRRRQGFNAVCISVLPIPHDRSVTPGRPERLPFAVGPDGSWDVGRLDEDYFRRSRGFAEAALEHGIVPVLVVLWCNYVPGTWGAELTPGLVMSAGQTARYVELVARTFGDLRPVLCVSGDDRFTSAEAGGRYVEVLQQLRQACPGSLVTAHSSPVAVLAPELTGSELDFYTYQSGHDTGWDTYSYEHAERYARMPGGLPVISIEPCYEGHGYGGGAGRHTARSVRQASWSSVLAGAGAGLGYGAHGLWSWHRPGDDFSGAHFSGEPFPADVAAGFPGAWDVGLLRGLVERHGLHRLMARQDLLQAGAYGARFGLDEQGGRAAVWLPHPFSIRLGCDLSGWQAECWDLARRRRDRAVVTVEDGVTSVAQPEFLGDALYVFWS